MKLCFKQIKNMKKSEHAYIMKSRREPGGLIVFSASLFK